MKLSLYIFILSRAVQENLCLPCILLQHLLEDAVRHGSDSWINRIEAFKIIMTMLHAKRLINRSKSICYCRTTC